MPIDVYVLSQHHSSLEWFGVYARNVRKRHATERASYDNGITRSNIMTFLGDPDTSRISRFPCPYPMR